MISRSSVLLPSKAWTSSYPRRWPAQLNVAHVLEGSVRKAGNRVRITAQLIEARSDTHLWSDVLRPRTRRHLRRAGRNCRSDQRDALKMKLALVAGEAVPPTAIKAASTDAYDAYLQGRELIHHSNREAMEEAVRHLERSVRLDDSFAPAHAQLAIVHHAADQLCLVRPRKGQANRHPAPGPSPGTRARSGRGTCWPGDTRFNMPTIRSPRLSMPERHWHPNPNYIEALIQLRHALGSLGRDEEAHAILEQILVIDPLSIVGRTAYAELAGRSRTDRRGPRGR